MQSVNSNLINNAEIVQISVESEITTAKIDATQTVDVETVKNATPDNKSIIEVINNLEIKDEHRAELAYVMDMLLDPYKKLMLERTFNELKQTPPEWFEFIGPPIDRTSEILTNNMPISSLQKNEK